MKICSRNSYKTYAATLIAAGILVGNMTTVLAFSPLEPFQKSETPTQRIEASEYTALSRASEALQRGQTMQAIPDLQATVEQNPVNVLGLFHLGNAYLDLAKQSEDPTQQANYLEMAQQAFEILGFRVALLRGRRAPIPAAVVAHHSMPRCERFPLVVPALSMQQSVV